MYNEDPSIITRCLIDAFNSSSVLEISNEELRGIELKNKTDS